MDVIIYTVMVTFGSPFGSYSSLLGCFSSLEAAKAAADRLIETHADLIKYGYFYDKMIRIEIGSRDMNECKLYSFAILTYSGTAKEWLKNPLADRLVKSTLKLSTEDDADGQSNS